MTESMLLADGLWFVCVCVAQVSVCCLSHPERRLMGWSSTSNRYTQTHTHKHTHSSFMSISFDFLSELYFESPLVSCVCVCVCVCVSEHE